jgi:dTDP-4-dehydrorhamnose reductase
MFSDARFRYDLCPGHRWAARRKLAGMKLPANTIAVTGAEGQLGSELCRQLGARAVPLSRAQCDLANAGQISSVLNELRPAVVINTAAFTAVDRAESEPDLAFAINSTAVGHLAEYCRQSGALLVQLSTDYVFGGDTTRQVPYAETDPPSPVNQYGHSKLAGEQQAAHATRHLIVRTCGLYGPITSPRHVNFVATMLRLASPSPPERGCKSRSNREQGEGKMESAVVSKPPLRIVNDQHCTPSYVPHVASAIIELIEAHATGIVHVTNDGATTWHDFAREIFRLRKIEIEVKPIPSTQYAAPAKRPGYSVLATDKLAGILGRKLTTWQSALAEFLRM